MISRGQKNSAISGAGIPNSRNARSQVCARNEPSQMATTLRLVSSHGAAGVVLATSPVASPPAYSRILAQFSFGMLPEALHGRSPRKLGERVFTTRSPFSSEFIQTVVAIFGALAARIFSVIPSSTYLAASSSGTKLEGVSA